LDDKQWRPTTACPIPTDDLTNACFVGIKKVWLQKTKVAALNGPDDVEERE
jgi:hypothetical protein